MTRSIRRVAVALSALLVLASSAAAQGRGTLSGRVTFPPGTTQTIVTVIITNAAGVDRRQVSEADGSWVIGGLLAGPYRVRIEDERFAPWSREGVVIVGGGKVALEIGLEPLVRAGAAPTAPATVSGTVIGPNGLPRANTAIIVTSVQGGAETRAVSSATGSFSVPNLAPGAYRVRVDAVEGALPFAMDAFTLAPGEQRPLSVRLQPVPPPPPIPERTTQAGGTGTVVVTTARPPSPPGTVPEASFNTPDFEAAPDRWRFDFPEYRRYSPPEQMPWVIASPLDPYNQHPLKADFPLGNSELFANLNMQANSNLNPRTVAVEGGTDSQVFNNNNFVLGFELFRGDTVFQPKTWAVRGTLVANANQVSGDPRDTSLNLEELFAEVRLGVISPSFDFASIRGGMQNFNSDFRGYLFVDNQLGARLFGNASANRLQYNAAFFSMRNRDGLQLHDFSSRNQNVVIGNLFIQDFLTEGYTALLSGHVNSDGGLEGDQFPLNVFYLGFHGDGRWGAWSISHAYYEAFGSDDFNQIARVPVDIRARMAAVEVSRDADWKRYRFSFFYASGDDAADDQATGFDAIIDNPNLAGGQFMFWTQQATNVGGVQISNGFSLLPNLRNKFTDRANFVNPGLMLFGGGVDLRMSPRLKIVTNANYLQFADNAVLEALFDGGFEDNSIGIDVSVGAKFRPFVNENLFLVPGVSLLLPQGGFSTAIGSSGPLFSFFTVIQAAF